MKGPTGLSDLTDPQEHLPNSHILRHWKLTSFFFPFCLCLRFLMFCYEKKYPSTPLAIGLGGLSSSQNDIIIITVMAKKTWATKLDESGLPKMAEQHCWGRWVHRTVCGLSKQQQQLHDREAVAESGPFFPSSCYCCGNSCQGPPNRGRTLPRLSAWIDLVFGGL